MERQKRMNQCHGEPKRGCRRVFIPVLRGKGPLVLAEVRRVLESDPLTTPVAKWSLLTLFFHK